MARDIYAFVEYRNAPSDKWLFFAKVHIPYESRLFRLLGNTTAPGHESPLIEARGLPVPADWVPFGDYPTGQVLSGDVSFAWDSTEEYFDPHDASWCNPIEFAHVAAGYMVASDLSHYELKALVLVLLTLPNARLVYWFDN